VIYRGLVVGLSFIMGSFAWGADGSSGCGPGWYVVKENSLVSSSVRGTTNGILGPVVTFGMTSGTSNCAKHKLVKSEKRSLHFATMNHFELKGEIAKGDGPYLNAFAQTLSCPPDVSQRLNRKLKGNFKSLYEGKRDPRRTLMEVHKIISQDEKLKRACKTALG
jgi:hypothetical protein